MAEEGAPASAQRVDADWLAPEVAARMGQPAGVGVTPEGNIVILHRGLSPNDSLLEEDAVLVVDPASGKLVHSFGGARFASPHGLHVDLDGGVWVTDTRRHQVFRFSPEGELKLTLGTAATAGDDERHFDQPTDVAVGPRGDIFVTDGYGNRRVVRFAPDGTYLASWGREGNAPGEFLNPHAIDIDGEGRLLVSDRDNNRLQIFNSRGELLDSVHTAAPLYAAVVDAPRGRLVATDYLTEDTTIVGSRVFGLSPDELDAPDATLFAREGCQGPASCRFHDVAVAPDGAVYLADLTNRVVWRVMD